MVYTFPVFLQANVSVTMVCCGPAHLFFGVSSHDQQQTPQHCQRLHCKASSPSLTGSIQNVMLRGGCLSLTGSIQNVISRTGCEQPVRGHTFCIKPVREVGHLTFENAVKVG